MRRRRRGKVDSKTSFAKCAALPQTSPTSYPPGCHLLPPKLRFFHIVEQFLHVSLKLVSSEHQIQITQHHGGVPGKGAAAATPLARAERSFRTAGLR